MPIVNKKRPVNLNLFSIRFPLTAVISIMHRLSGVVTFLWIPVSIWALDRSLASPESFEQLHTDFAQPGMKFLLWLLVSPFLFHFVSGIRHLLMDINIGIEARTGKQTALVAIIAGFLLIFLAGIYIW